MGRRELGSLERKVGARWGVAREEGWCTSVRHCDFGKFI